MGFKGTGTPSLQQWEINVVAQSGGRQTSLGTPSRVGETFILLPLLRPPPACLRRQATPTLKPRNCPARPPPRPPPSAGISGAGRSAKQNLLYAEATEGVNAYGVTRHRHMPEIEQASTLMGAGGGVRDDLCWLGVDMRLGLSRRVP